MLWGALKFYWDFATRLNPWSENFGVVKKEIKENFIG